MKKNNQKRLERINNRLLQESERRQNKMIEDMAKHREEIFKRASKSECAHTVESLSCDMGYFIQIISNLQSIVVYQQNRISVMEKLLGVIGT